MMKAVRIHDYGTAEVLCYEDDPIHEPGPREVLSSSSKASKSSGICAKWTKDTKYSGVELNQIGHFE